MNEVPQGEMKMADLSARTGVPPRTVRLYISRGLVPAPRRVGRGAAYGPEHLQALKTIRQLQAQGLSLRAIGRRLSAAEESKAAVAEPEAWWRYPVGSDVVVLVRADGPPWRRRRIHRAVARLVEDLSDAEGKDQNDGTGSE